MLFKFFFLYAITIVLISASSFGKNKFSSRPTFPSSSIFPRKTFFKTTYSTTTRSTITRSIATRSTTTKVPARGDHVINNSVLRVYKDIIDGFLQQNLKTTCASIISRLKFATSTSLYRDYNNAIANNIEKNIQTEMVVHYPSGHRPVDLNSVPYGVAIRDLRNAAMLYMAELYNTVSYIRSMNSMRYLNNVKSVVVRINSGSLYIDNSARDTWLSKSTNNRNIYENARLAVRSMFQNLPDKLTNWVRDIKLAQS